MIADEGDKCFAAHRSRKIISLKMMATVAPQPFIFFPSLNPFGEHADAEATAQCHDRLTNCLVIGLGINVGDECAVNFNLVERKLSE